MGTVYNCSMSAGFAACLPPHAPFFDDARSCYFAVHVNFLHVFRSNHRADHSPFPPILGSLVVPRRVFFAAPAALALTILSGIGVAVPPGALDGFSPHMLSFARSVVAASPAYRILPLCVQVVAETFPVTYFPYYGVPASYPLTCFPHLREESETATATATAAATTSLGVRYYDDYDEEEDEETASEAESETRESAPATGSMEEAAEIEADLGSANDGSEKEGSFEEFFSSSELKDEDEGGGEEIELNFCRTEVQAEGWNLNGFFSPDGSEEDEDIDDDDDDDDNSKGYENDEPSNNTDARDHRDSTTTTTAITSKEQVPSLEDHDRSESIQGSNEDEDDGDDREVFRRLFRLDFQETMESSNIEEHHHQERLSNFRSIIRYFREVYLSSSGFLLNAFSSLSVTLDYYSDDDDSVDHDHVDHNRAFYENVDDDATDIDDDDDEDEGGAAVEFLYSSSSLLNAFSSLSLELDNHGNSDDDDNVDHDDNAIDHNQANDVDEDEENENDDVDEDEAEDESEDDDAIEFDEEEVFMEVPASKTSIEALKEVDTSTITEDSQCSVCFNDLSSSHGLDDGDDDQNRVVVRMPCSHLYHKVCIVKWLKKSHVCPLCRHAMPTNSPSDSNTL